MRKDILSKQPFVFNKRAAEPPHHNGSSSLGEVKHAGSEENPTESLTEKSRLTELEEIIDREERSDAHLAIGNALKEINEDRFYRDAGFRAFSAYVKARFDYRLLYAYRL